MKLSEVTKEYLESFRLSETSEVGPPPNMLTWLQLSLKFKENTVKLKSIEEIDDCWVWVGRHKNLNFSVIDHSIGHVTNIIVMSLRRFSYYMYNQEHDTEKLAEAYTLMNKKPKKFIHNSCSNKHCYNPDHHYESFTPYDPARSPHVPTGEKSYNAKLTEQQVREIFTLKEKYSKIAEKYNVTKACISHIKSGTTWKHLFLKNN